MAMDTAAGVMDTLYKMRPTRLRAVARMQGDPATLSFQERVFVEKYVSLMDRYRAAEAAGYDNPGRMARQIWSAKTYLAVRVAILEKLKQREAVSDMKAEYVREYIKNVLEFSPLDFFLPAPGGGWLITPESLKSIPEHVKKLIENVELRTHQGVQYLGITFISKTAALAMAAKYTLTQKLDVAVPSLPWEKIAKQVEDEGRSIVDLRLAELDAEEGAMVRTTDVA